MLVLIFTFHCKSLQGGVARWLTPQNLEGDPHRHPRPGKEGERDALWNTHTASGCRVGRWEQGRTLYVSLEGRQRPPPPLGVLLPRDWAHGTADLRGCWKQSARCQEWPACQAEGLSQPGRQGMRTPGLSGLLGEAVAPCSPPSRPTPLSLLPPTALGFTLLSSALASHFHSLSLVLCMNPRSWHFKCIIIVIILIVWDFRTVNKMAIGTHRSIMILVV